jgi:uncharacterized membrane protein
MSLPPIPPWDALHPIIIHFPIGLLLVAPMPIILGLIWHRQSQGLFFAALALMVLGTISAFIAVATGEAAGQLAPRTPAINPVLERHEELADTTRIVFTVLTAIFAVLVVAPLFLRRELTRLPQAFLHIAFLVFYMGGALVLVNTGHLGGLLVHEHGVRALLPASFSAFPGAGAPPEADRGRSAHEGDD